MSSGPLSVEPIPVSEKELFRRWQAVRKEMRERDLDFLIFQNRNSELPGYVKWFTDANFTGFPSATTVIFPREDEMIVVKGGMKEGEILKPKEFRGVKKQISVFGQTWTSLSFANTFDAEKVVAELSPFKNSKIGWVGLSYFQAAFYQYVTEKLSAKFEDATAWVDRIKAIKSTEEIPLIKETCALEDRLFEYTLTQVKPGIVDSDVQANVISKCKEWGANFNIMVMSTPPNVCPKPFAPARLLQKDDVFIILIETSSPTCYWGELARTVCLGKIPNQLQEQFEIAKQAQQATCDLLKPGASPESIWLANDNFIKSKGYSGGRRLYAHGQGVDIVESPSLEPRETMTVEAGMFFAVHPTVVSDQANGWICDNYLVKETGNPEWFHKTPGIIFQV